MPFIEEGPIVEAPGTLVPEMVRQVLAEAAVDATTEQALGWMNVRHRQMVVRSKCFRRTFVKTTVAKQQNYPLPSEVFEVREVAVNGIVYGTGRHNDLAEGKRGWIWLAREGGIAMRDDDEEGQDALAIYPTPEETGQEIRVMAACRPPNLSVTDDSTLKIPTDFTDALVSGTLATAMLRLESRPDLAAAYEQIFTQGCTELLQQTNRKYRGIGPAQIRVQGVNA